MSPILLFQQLEPNEILDRLGPNSDPGLPWTIFIYIIFFLAVITMFMQSSKTTTPQLMMAGVAGASVIDKLAVFPATDLGTFLAHSVMFTIPILTAGMTKAPKSRGPAIIGGVIGGVYFFAFWFFMQRGA
ncbi:MAG: hypothetical protein D6737_12355 [Chloroflexi bacterium]|nr:MAG: hypothetical protein CUN54_01515 [Phototrophicales bacterium]RMF79213.1 MAG: hypothetical protein D6737_12355 [Chloroflexota bacterium]